MTWDSCLASPAILWLLLAQACCKILDCFQGFGSCLGMHPESRRFSTHRAPEEGAPGEPVTCCCQQDLEPFLCSSRPYHTLPCPTPTPVTVTAWLAKPSIFPGSSLSQPFELCIQSKPFSSRSCVTGLHMATAELMQVESFIL